MPRTNLPLNPLLLTLTLAAGLASPLALGADEAPESPPPAEEKGVEHGGQPEESGAKAAGEGNDADYVKVRVSLPDGRTFVHLEPKRKLSARYIRPGSSPASSSRKVSRSGRVSVASRSVSGGSNSSSVRSGGSGSGGGGSSSSSSAGGGGGAAKGGAESGAEGGLSTGTAKSTGGVSSFGRSAAKACAPVTGESGSGSVSSGSTGSSSSCSAASSMGAPDLSFSGGSSSFSASGEGDSSGTPSSGNTSISSFGPIASSFSAAGSAGTQSGGSAGAGTGGVSTYGRSSSSSASSAGGESGSTQSNASAGSSSGSGQGSAGASGSASANSTPRANTVRPVIPTVGSPRYDSDGNATGGQRVEFRDAGMSAAVIGTRVYLNNVELAAADRPFEVITGTRLGHDSAMMDRGRLSSTGVENLSSFNTGSSAIKLEFESGTEVTLTLYTQSQNLLNPERETRTWTVRIR